MHRLAQEYYHFRDNVFHFLPLTLLTMVSGVFAFVGTSDFFEPQTNKVFSLFVGICTIVSAAVQSCAKNAKYAARSEMHRTAALGMKNLRDDVEFSQIDPERGLLTRDHSSYNRQQTSDGEQQDPAAAPVFQSSPTMTQKVQAYRATFTQVLASCDSTIPSPVLQAFSLVDTRLTIALQNKPNIQSVERDVISLACFNELYSEFSNTLLWPLIPLRPHYAVNRAIHKVNQSFSTENQFLTDTSIYDLEEGVTALFLWVCGCDSTSWIWTCCRRTRRANQKKEREERQSFISN
jgi:hypothetical protein